MKRSVLFSAVTAIVVVIMLVAAFVPVVEYRLSVSNPGFPYTVDGYKTCSAKLGNTINSTNEKAWNECLAASSFSPN